MKKKKFKDHKAPRGHMIIPKTQRRLTNHNAMPSIDRAFDRLNSYGILAKQNWTCCQSCGHAEMKDEISRMKDSIMDKETEYALDKGNYIFYHDQDADHLKERGHTYLAYDLDEEAKKQVMEVLEHYGLQPEWNGQQDTRIKITERSIQ